jgi:hypothetical protein
VDRYDPLVAPDPYEWSELDEGERIALVEAYHRDARVRLPNLKVHAVVHVAVENQISLGDETPVQRTVQRLMNEGLDRHAAIHAVGKVLFEYMFDFLQPSNSGAARDPNPAYFAALEKITAEEWRKSG